MQIICLLTLIVTVSAIHDELWHRWKQEYEKVYSNDRNEQSRRAVWESNVETMLQHNLRYDLGLESYTMGLNQFTDLTWEEFKDQYLIQLTLESLEDDSSRIPFESEMDENEPESIDWREKGMVTAVKNQGGCGSCWSFSATGALEAQYKKVSGELVPLSEQQLVDCTRHMGNHGCHGGLMGISFRYLENNGLESEFDYPYHARDQTCKYNNTKAIVKVIDFYRIPRGNESILKTMVGTRGPVAVAINVIKPFFMYKSGVFKIDTCRQSPLNHAVLVTGYGIDNGTEYWTVKNSWGPRWGDHGYIRMARNYKNMCGISNLASVPRVERFLA